MEVRLKGLKGSLGGGCSDDGPDGRDDIRQCEDGLTRRQKGSAHVFAFGFHGLIVFT